MKKRIGFLFAVIICVLVAGFCVFKKAFCEDDDLLLEGLCVSDIPTGYYQ
jgi:hypothetical protein